MINTLVNVGESPGNFYFLKTNLLTNGSSSARLDSQRRGGITKTNKQNQLAKKSFIGSFRKISRIYSSFWLSVRYDWIGSDFPFSVGTGTCSRASLRSSERNFHIRRRGKCRASTVAVFNSENKNSRKLGHAIFSDKMCRLWPNGFTPSARPLACQWRATYLWLVCLEPMFAVETLSCWRRLDGPRRI